MEFVPGLGGARDVELLEDLGGAVEHEDHAAFELGGQDGLHGDAGCAGGPEARGLLPEPAHPTASGGGASTAEARGTAEGNGFGHAG